MYVGERKKCANARVGVPRAPEADAVAKNCKPVAYLGQSICKCGPLSCNANAAGENLKTLSGS